MSRTTDSRQTPNNMYYACTYRGPIYMYTLLAILACVATVTQAQLTWSRMQPSDGSMPDGRRDHALGYDSLRHRLVLYGGRGSKVFGDTWTFDIGSNTWQQSTASPSPPARFSMVYGVSADYFYVSTGQNGPTLYDDLWRLDLSTLQWSQLNPAGTGPVKVYGAAGGFYANSTNFYVSHGFSASQRYANTFLYDVTADRWTEVYPDASSYTPNHPHGRCLLSGTMVDTDKLVIYGGCMSGGKTGGHCPAFDSWIFDRKSEEWTQYPYCPSARTYSSMGLLPSTGNNKRVVLYGGNEGGGQVLVTTEAPSNQVAVLNVNDGTWSLKKALGTEIPSKRFGASLISQPRGLYLFGGNTNQGSMNDLWELRGDSDEADKSAGLGECIAPFKGFFNLIMLHVVFMFSGWGILLQAGAFIARYFRWKDPLWFHLHRVCQVTGVLFTIGGFGCAVASVQFDHFNFLHGGLGLVIMILGLQQPVNGILRPHKVKGEPLTLKRKIWEYFHLYSGRLALILAVVNISLGLYLEVSSRATLILWYVYVAVVVVVYVVMEVRLQLKRKRGDENRKNDINME